MFKIFRSGKVWTIPNIMSMFRLLLVPFIIWAYVGLDNTPLTIGLLALSALTDVLDGQIARKFNMISDLGKALDPFADKVTQVCVILCLAIKLAIKENPLLWILLGICVFREISMGVLGYLTIRRTGNVPGARWYGKVSTVVLYASALALLIFRDMPSWLSTLLIILCMVCVSSALILYTIYFVGEWKKPKEAPAAAKQAK
jgi:cardiolipin synthase